MTNFERTNRDEIISRSNIATALQMIEQGKVPQKELAISDAQMEQQYAHGVELLNSGATVEAAAIFSRLAALNPSDKSYWLSLSAAEICAQQWEASLTALAMASVVDPTDPQPHHYAGLCHLALEQKELARRSFVLAQKLCGPTDGQLAQDVGRWLKELD